MGSRVADDEPVDRPGPHGATGILQAGGQSMTIRRRFPGQKHATPTHRTQLEAGLVHQLSQAGQIIGDRRSGRLHVAGFRKARTGAGRPC